MASVNDLASLIAQELSKYSKEVATEVKKICKDVSKEMTENIKQDSKSKFGGTGAYAEGWQTKVMFESNEEVRIKTYNKDHYQLTHLLEYGHAKQNGGRVEGKAHIKPNEEQAKTKLVDRITKAVERN